MFQDRVIDETATYSSLLLGTLSLKLSSDNNHSVLLVVCEMCSLRSAMPQSLRAVKEMG